MSAATVNEQLVETSMLYAGFANAFRYPEDETGYLTGAEYIEAFDMAASNEAASIHETGYVDMDRSALFEELVRFYEHFGLRRNQDAELPDHISVELEFMHFLGELERHALERGDDVESVRRAERDFIDRHLRRLLRGLRGKRGDRPGPASELVEDCLAFIESHRQALTAEN